MIRRLVVTILLLAWAAPAIPAMAAEPAEEVKLRNWHFGFQGVGTQRNTFDVFGVPGQPPGAVTDKGEGAGLFVGYRFGDRFLLGLHGTVSVHELENRSNEVSVADFMFTGTVLFRERSTLQPFLRGGFGVGLEALSLIPDGGDLRALGTAAIAGGGLQVRLSSRFSLELEMVSTFNNFLEVYDFSNGDLWPEKSWQVRTSNWGTRFGAGVVVWF